jgi:hypothetical protein
MANDAATRNGTTSSKAGRRIDLAHLELKALPLASLLITERVAAEVGD